MINDGAVNTSLISVGLASGKFAAINPNAGEIAAPAMTVAIAIEIIVGFNIRFIKLKNTLLPIHIRLEEKAQ